MKDKKIKVAMVTNHFGITGISQVILNYCKALNRDRFDLTVIAGEPFAPENREECEQNGIKFVVLPSRHQKSFRHYFGLWKALKNNFDIVHVHGGSSIMAVELTIARLAGVKIRIAHSHNSACPNMKIHKILNPYFKKTYTKALACGELAGNWLFGENNFEVLPNVFHTGNFKFDPSKRERVRKELNLENRFVLGHIGRFNKQKNQPYLLKIFEKLAQKRGDAVLLLAGTGPDFEKTKALVDTHPYKERIILYGTTKDASAVYSAMDYFALPSLHEGLPVVLLEAQISGLPCVVSDKVTKEVDFGGICWASVEDSPNVWAEIILDSYISRETDRQGYYEKHNKQIAEYDIENTVNQLERIYFELTQNR